MDRQEIILVERNTRGVIMKEANKITEGALLTAIYIVLLLVVLFVPFIFVIGLVMLPIPFIIYTKRHNFRAGLIMLLVASSLTMLFATIVSLPITLLAGIGGIVIGRALHRQRKPYETWARGTLGFILGILLVIVLMYVVLDINVYKQTEQLIEESLSMTSSMMQKFNINIEEREEFELIADQMRTFPDLLPAAIAIMSILLALGSMWLSFKVMNRIDHEKLAFPPFKQFALPKGIVWLYIIALFTTLFVTDTNHTFFIAALNMSMLIATLFVIQGFSFIFFYADLQKWSRAVPMIIVVVSFLIPFISMIIVRFIGIIDILFDLKSRLLQTDEK